MSGRRSPWPPQPEKWQRDKDPLRSPEPSIEILESDYRDTKEEHYVVRRTGPVPLLLQEEIKRRCSLMPPHHGIHKNRSRSIWAQVHKEMQKELRPICEATVAEIEPLAATITNSVHDTVMEELMSQVQPRFRNLAAKNAGFLWQAADIIHERLLKQTYACRWLEMAFSLAAGNRDAGHILMTMVEHDVSLCLGDDPMAALRVMAGVQAFVDRHARVE